MIKSIDQSILWNGRGDDPTWFHPRACMIPGEQNPIALMTLQTISGSDFFGPVHWTTSCDMGATWRKPAPIPSFGRRNLPNGVEEGVCDVVPEYHPPTDTVLALGHNVYYHHNALMLPQDRRYSVYVVRESDGRWSEKRILKWDDARATGMYSCGCAQRVTLQDGNVLVPFCFTPVGREDYSVCTVLCSFDGQNVEIQRVSNELRLPVKRGLLEPSITRSAGRFFLTIRAEDERGYVSTSGDGLNWSEQCAWRWDDGQPLAMSTTQQRWLAHGDELYLVYTRKAEANVNVFRWRAPLYVARVDTERPCLIRETEKVILPLIGDGINNPDHVARMGNFHVTNASADESWVTAGECLPHDDWKGDTYLARIRFAEQVMPR